ncbi:unnamed protein product [Echinostoma caproni]|uniref:glutathione transferase n=1 Tax=Echinostoma caproni TaxID=27848 RepID=A0A3P8LCX8_9TREM|nr:unnamed protein product [Echinostoma caproni]
MFLEYLGEAYEDRLYGHDDIEKWKAQKYSLGLELPNLPYYIDGDLKITQSSAILRYLAEKHAMVSQTPEERSRIIMIEGAALDLRTGLIRIVFDSRYDALKEDYRNSLPETMKIWSIFLGTKLYLTGTEVSMYSLMEERIFPYLSENHKVSKKNIT